MIARAVLVFYGLLTGSALAQDLSPICPDRPGKGTSACTLDSGHWQMEAGLWDESLMHRHGVTTDMTVAGNLLLKYGLDDRADLEAGLALYQEQRLHDAGGTQATQSVGDLYLHAKYNPMPDGGGFALVLDPYVKLPTGGALGNGRVEGGLVVPMGWDLGDSWSLAMTPEADILADAADGGTHMQWVNVAGIGKSLGPLTLGAEIWTSQNDDPAAASAQYSFDLDAAWLADKDSQLDAGLDLGLNRATPDLELYAGISRRF